MQFFLGTSGSLNFELYAVGFSSKEVGMTKHRELKYWPTISKHDSVLNEFEDEESTCEEAGGIGRAADQLRVLRTGRSLEDSLFLVSILTMRC